LHLRARIQQGLLWPPAVQKARIFRKHILWHPVTFERPLKDIAS
jgi:hypothetical protein